MNCFSVQIFKISSTRESVLDMALNTLENQSSC